MPSSVARSSPAVLRSAHLPSPVRSTRPGVSSARPFASSHAGRADPLVHAEHDSGSGVLPPSLRLATRVAGPEIVPRRHWSAVERLPPRRLAVRVVADLPHALAVHVLLLL